MKRAKVYSNGVWAGYLIENDDRSYCFVYDSIYLADPNSMAVSLTLPKRVEPYHSEVFFPFFFNMLSEGDNKAIQCRMLKIDEDDYFELLVSTATVDTIGAITLKRYDTDK